MPLAVDALSQALTTPTDQSPVPVPAAPAPILKTPVQAVKPVVAQPQKIVAQPVAEPETKEQRAERLFQEFETFVKDPSTDPEARKYLKDIASQEDVVKSQSELIKKQYERRAQLEEQAAAKMEEYLYKRQLMGEVPQLQQTAQKQAPFLMIMMSLLGKSARLPGIAMLQGSTGMIQGLQQADINAYNAAVKKYTDGANQLKDIYDTWNKVYEMRMKASGDNIAAMQEAVSMANTAVGADEKAIGKIGDVKKSLADSAKNLFEASAKVKNDAERIQDNERIRNESLNLRREALQQNKQAKQEKLEAASTKSLDTARGNLDDLMDAKRLWDEAVQQMGGEINASSVISSDLYQRVLAKNDAYGRAVQKMRDITGASLATQNEGLSGAAQRIARVEHAELDSLPNPQGKTVAQVTQSLNDMIRKTQRAVNHYNRTLGQEIEYPEVEPQVRIPAAAAAAKIPPRPQGVPANAGYSASQNKWWWKDANGKDVHN